MDELAHRLACRLRRSFRFGARIAEASVGGETVMLVEPQKYMNRSGVAVGRILRCNGLGPSDMIVTLDDADLDPGRLRVRSKGSSGGHRGLQSIVEAIGSEEFARVRIGIGRGGQDDDLVRHVLTKLRPEDREAVNSAVQRAAEAVLCIVADGIDEAMNKFNAR